MVNRTYLIETRNEHTSISVEHLCFILKLANKRTHRSRSRQIDVTVRKKRPGKIGSRAARGRNLEVYKQARPKIAGRTTEGKTKSYSMALIDRTPPMSQHPLPPPLTPNKQTRNGCIKSDQPTMTLIRTICDTAARMELIWKVYPSPVIGAEFPIYIRI